MKTFQVSNGNVEPTPELLTIPEFKKIWDKDKSKTKSDSLAIFSYVYHLIDTKSLYVNYANRESKCKSDFIPNKNITEDILNACKKYKDLITTPEERLLNASFIACDKLSSYLENIDFTKVDMKGNLVDDPHKLITSLKSVKIVIAQLQELRAMTEKGQDEKEQMRANQKLNMFDEELT